MEAQDEKCGYVGPAGNKCNRPRYGENEDRCVFHLSDTTWTADRLNNFHKNISQELDIVGEGREARTEFDFSGFVFPQFELKKKIFNLPVILQGARFTGTLVFDGCYFWKDLNMRDCTFEGDRTVFQDCQLGGPQTVTDLSGSICRGRFVWHYGFVGTARMEFNKCDFHGGIEFMTSMDGQLGTTSFDGSTFGGTETVFEIRETRGHLSFMAAKFRSLRTKFEIEYYFPSKETNLCFDTAMFLGSQTRFVIGTESTLTFDHCSFQGATSFEGSWRPRWSVPLIPDLSYKEIDLSMANGFELINLNLSRTTFLGTELRRIDFTGVVWARIPKEVLFLKYGSRNVLFDEMRLLGERQQSRILERDSGSIAWLERAYNHLRLSMERNKKYPEAGDFYFAEMDMARKLVTTRSYWWN